MQAWTAIRTTSRFAWNSPGSGRNIVTLDTAIDAMSLTGRSDALQLQRLKKKKLALKDRISTLEDKLLPDIIA